MARGGFRPGAGRKKGTKDSKPRKGTEAHQEAEKIREMLSYGTKAKARFYQEFLSRMGKGEKLSLGEKRMMDTLAVELAAEVGGERPQGEPGTMTPLEYMLRVMNDPNEDKELRARMAQAAAPYCHDRKGDGLGKKEERDGRARAAGSGKFAAGKAPLTVVK